MTPRYERTERLYREEGLSLRLRQHPDPPRALGQVKSGPGSGYIAIYLPGIGRMDMEHSRPDKPTDNGFVESSTGNSGMNASTRT